MVTRIRFSESLSEDTSNGITDYPQYTIGFILAKTFLFFYSFSTEYQEIHHRARRTSKERWFETSSNRYALQIARTSIYYGIAMALHHAAHTGAGKISREQKKKKE